MRSKNVVDVAFAVIASRHQFLVGLRQDTKISSEAVVTDGVAWVTSLLVCLLCTTVSPTKQVVCCHIGVSS